MQNGDTMTGSDGVGRVAGKLRFTRLRLENWKNFRHADVALQRRSFIVGPNASGKSNFLDAFRFLNDLATNGGGFQSAVQRRSSVSAIRNLAARRYPAITLDAEIGTSDHPVVWSYRLSFTQDNNRVPQIARERIEHFGQVMLNRPDPEDYSDPDRLTQTYLEQVNANKAFRELAEFFAAIRYLHVVPQLIREPDRSVGRRNDPFGGDFLEQLARTQKKTLDSRLKRIRKALQSSVPQLAELELQRDDRGTPHLRGRYQHWRSNAGWQNEDQLSDGTLRLIGLLWAMLDGSGPLMLEEPELSLHTAIVKKIPEIIYQMQRRNDRQIVLSTHAEDMLVNSGVGANEVLVVTPASEGSKIQLAASIAEVQQLLLAGETLAEAVMPITAPRSVEELPLFMDLK